MRVKNYLKFFAAILVAELAGFIGAVFTTPAIATWYTGLTKPPLTPPNSVFAPVWTTLFALLGISLFLVWKSNWKVTHHLYEDNKHRGWNKWSRRFWTGDWQKENIIAIFAAQYILSILWSYLFFGLHLPVVAFFGIVALWVSIVYLIINFYRVSKTAAYLLVPYLIWVTFAAYLNFSIWILNP